MTEIDPKHFRSVMGQVPTTVTVVAPVEATFVATAVLDSIDACVNVADVLPTSWCTVDATSLVAPMPLAAFTTTHVSDPHTVDVTIVIPMRIAKLRAWRWPT